MTQQIKLHQTSHLPSGNDPLPWLGDYPYPGAGGNQGIHMIGLAADMPTPSLGTQSGADGAVGSGSTAFSAASGRFSAADTGATITIIDTGAAVPTSYTFTVTYVSGTALTLSSAWAGTGTSALSWLVTGRGPSNAGLMYFATDDVPVGAGGIQFNSGTYGPDNVGDWLIVEASGGIPSGTNFTVHPIADTIDGYGIALNATDGMFITSNAGAIPLTIGINDDVLGVSGSTTGLFIYVNAENGQALGSDIATGTTGSGQSTAGSFSTANSGSGQGTALALDSLTQGAGDSVGIDLGTDYGGSGVSASGGGDAYGIDAVVVSDLGQAWGMNASVRVGAGSSGDAYGAFLNAGIIGAGSGDAYGGHINGTAGTTGTAYGLQAQGTNPGSGDAIGVKAIADNTGSGNEYPYEGYAGTTLVFRVDSDGTVHVKTGASTSLIADL